MKTLKLRIALVNVKGCSWPVIQWTAQLGFRTYRGLTWGDVRTLIEGTTRYNPTTKRWEQATPAQNLTPEAAAHFERASWANNLAAFIGKPHHIQTGKTSGNKDSSSCNGHIRTVITAGEPEWYDDGDLACWLHPCESFLTYAGHVLLAEFDPTYPPPFAATADNTTGGSDVAA